MGKYSVEKCVQELIKLEPEEILGAFKIIGVQLMNGDEPKEFFQLLGEAIGLIEKMNRTKRKNLLRLLRAANEGR